MQSSPLTVSGTCPRSEHPNPQFERSSWSTLNGIWEFRFDDADEGLRQRWASSAEPLGTHILAPFCFESTASGIGDHGMHRVCWYRRNFHVPDEWKDRRILLHFGAVDYRARVWINGVFAGGHEGGQTPFSIDITDQLNDTEQVVTVRAEDPPADRSIPRGKQYWKEKPESIWYMRTSGIWQSVWIEAVGQSYLESVRITASHDGHLTLEPSIVANEPGLEFTAKVTKGGAPVWKGSATVTEGRGPLATLIEDARSWSPERPELYDVTFELAHEGRLIDRVQSYLGFRSIEIRDGAFYLNNEPLQLRLVLDQGYWPETLMTPPNDEAIQFDIRAAKEFGFNGVRKHQKVEDPRYLYWADRMGLLVSAEIGNAYSFSHDAAARLTREWTDAVLRDANHPSIVLWVPLNESWGVPDLNTPAQREFLRGLYSLTKSLDPTRPVIDNDGWEHTDSTDLFALHDYTPAGDQLTAKYEAAFAARVLPRVPRPVMVSGCKYNGAPLYLSEMGGVSYALPNTDTPSNSWGYHGIETEHHRALDRIRGLLSSAVRLPGSVGFCYTQLVDVEQEINGLLTYDRRYKYDPKLIRDAIEHPVTPAEGDHETKVYSLVAKAINDAAAKSAGWAHRAGSWIVYADASGNCVEVRKTDEAAMNAHPD